MDRCLTPIVLAPLHGAHKMIVLWPLPSQLCSRLPDASVLPSGLNVRRWMLLEVPPLSSSGGWRFSTSHTLTAPFSWPVTKRLPSRLTAIQQFPEHDKTQ